MEIEIRTYRVEPDPPPAVRKVMLPLSIGAAAVGLPEIKTASHPLPLKIPAAETASEPLIVSPASKGVPIRDASGGKPLTRKIRIEKAAKIKTRAVAAALPTQPRAIRLECRPPETTPTFGSPYLDHAMISRQALERKHIPYPVMTEYMIALAERNKTAYTNISFIGVFDPVPMHYAKNIALDADRGVMKFSVRKSPVETSGRKIVRVVYGRMRSTGNIVSALLPVT